MTGARTPTMPSEAVHLTEEGAGILVFVFLAVLALLATAVVLAVAGCVLAYRAGRGSGWALRAWIGTGAVFALVLLRSIADIDDASLSEPDLVAAGVLAVQGALYGLGRALGPRRPTSAGGRRQPADREMPAGPGGSGGTG